MQTICEKKNFNLTKALTYYRDSHMEVQEKYRKNGVHDDNEIMAAAINMNKYFEAWLGE